MKVLVACEESQAVCKSFRELGHEAFSCDVEECSGGHPEWHLEGDVSKYLYSENWDLMIAHPPCTRLCNSGVRWLDERNLWKEMAEAALFFTRLMDSPIPMIAIENPIPHKHALKIIMHKYDQIIQPWQFGHGETKATCLWLKNLPNLIPTDIVEEREARIHKLPPSKDRSKLRSKTYPGIAKAMAEQWGSLIPLENDVENWSWNVPCTNDKTEKDRVSDAVHAKQDALRGSDEK